MPFTFIDSVTANDNTEAWSINIPGNAQSGDVAVIFIYANGWNAGSDPDASWDAILEQNIGSHRGRVFLQQFDGTPPASAGGPFDTFIRWAAGVFVYRPSGAVNIEDLMQVITFQDGGNAGIGTQLIAPDAIITDAPVLLLRSWYLSGGGNITPDDGNLNHRASFGQGAITGRPNAAVADTIHESTGSAGTSNATAAETGSSSIRAGITLALFAESDSPSHDILVRPLRDTGPFA